MNPANLVSTGRDINYPRSRNHQIKQLRREKKMAKMIDAELPFNSFLRLLPIKGNKSCIINKNINTWIFFSYISCCIPDRSKISEVTYYKIQLSFLFSCQRVNGIPAPFLISAEH